MIEKKKTEKPYCKGLVGNFAKIKTPNQTFWGKIILETKNTIKIETEKGQRTIIKKNAEITIGSEKITGKSITKRTEDRIKLR